MGSRLKKIKVNVNILIELINSKISSSKWHVLRSLLSLPSWFKLDSASHLKMIQIYWRQGMNVIVMSYVLLQIAQLLLLQNYVQENAPTQSAMLILVLLLMSRGV